MAEITALVHTKNSAKTLQACLESLRFANLVFVVDMGSTDKTKEIAATFPNVKILEHEDVGYVEPARKFALEQVKTPWTLIIDSDEEVSPTLAAELQKIAATTDSADIYKIPRKNIIFKKWIAHTGWWPDYQLRFFKTGMITWPAEIHAQPALKGRHETLPANEALAITHHNYQTIEQFIERLNRYTSIEVKHSQQGPQPSDSTQDNIPAVFSAEFCRRFFDQEGYKDGQHGLALSYLQAMYQVSFHLKTWQLEGFPEVCDPADKTSPAADTTHTIAQLHQALKDIEYWIADYHVKHSSGLAKIWRQIRRKLRF